MIERVENPGCFFDSEPSQLEEVVFAVRRAFGRELEFKDIYAHITLPKEVYLLRHKERIVGVASYNKVNLSGLPSLIVEGIAIAPEMQGKGVFREMTRLASDGEAVICLRTQNPRMYRALEKYCSFIYPGKIQMPEAIEAIRKSLAIHLKCKADERGIIQRYYGGLFYGEEPRHEQASRFFKEIGIDINIGDALLVVGVK